MLAIGWNVGHFEFSFSWYIDEVLIRQKITRGNKTNAVVPASTQWQWFDDYKMFSTIETVLNFNLANFKKTFEIAFLQNDSLFRTETI